MPEIIFIRHGKTKGNLEGRYIGAKTDEPLCEEGILELQSMIDLYPRPCDKIYVSPMIRCRQSAELIYPDTTYEIAQELRECDFGRFENKNYKELSKYSDYQAWVDSGGTLPFPGGESREGFIRRCADYFHVIIEQILQEKYERVAVVAHGGIIMGILYEFARPKMDYYTWQVKNAEGFITRLTNDNTLEVIERLSHGQI